MRNKGVSRAPGGVAYNPCPIFVSVKTLSARLIEPLTIT